ncbi:E-selectin [Elysia marginata]|uniref:E-selectin n=1 Tax=Elysia marginata TaxID=1093978 RepID=A0AAV4JIQ7_9GAST|nr:E-selectin [Elysia marginata]
MVKFRGSQGFLYNPVSGLCTPLLWLEGAQSPNALPVHAEEGDLYLVTRWCSGDGFQLVEISTGELACVRHITHFASYQTAAQACSSMNSYLVSVKTSAKLDVIRRLASSSNAWVGIDSLGGSLTWVKDGQGLTEEEKNAVFFPGEPNNAFGDERCVEYSKDFQMLNDIKCENSCTFICEKSLPRLLGKHDSDKD